MSSKNSNSHGSVHNVACCVKECKYHSQQDYCNAKEITVENENAQRKGETFCATFENRATL